MYHAAGIWDFGMIFLTKLLLMNHFLPAMRFELIPLCRERILSPQCLPFHHAGITFRSYHETMGFEKGISLFGYCVPSSVPPRLCASV